jgi:hypothetical protein
MLAASWLAEQCSSDWILRVDDDEVEFPRFGGQGLIKQPRWLVSL